MDKIILGRTSVNTFIKNSALACVGGYACGHGIRYQRENPGTFKRFVKYSLVAGCVAGVHGLIVGRGRGPIFVAANQTVVGSCVAFGFFSLRGALKTQIEKYVPPTPDAPIRNELLITSVTTGITFAALGRLAGGSPKSILRRTSAGLVLGFIGHIVYDKSLFIRSEILFRSRHKKLLSELKEAENYMGEQQKSDPEYKGPVKPTPSILTWAARIMRKKTKDEIIEMQLADEKT